MHVHILGICGTFMGGIAALARQQGHRVTGCDARVYPPMSTQLANLGIALIEGYDAGQLALRPDLWVIGNVVSRGNPLLEAILDAGERYVSGPQWLADSVLESKWVLAIAGTHGKTTTASMLAWILQANGEPPGFLIGGVPQNFGISARITDSRYFVIEADEYDTAFFDKRSKFVHYRPRTAVINNLELDHADIFPDLASIETQFHHLVRTVPSSGRIIANGLEDAVERVLGRGCWTPVERIGVDEGWKAREYADGSFRVLNGGRVVGTVCWELLGRHNQMNALAAIAAANHAGIGADAAARSLADFRNVRRRMELRGVAGGVHVYDDFAHHPTAIATTIAGLRSKVGTQRILAVVEPRSNTMKLGVMKAALPGSLDAADRIFCFTGELGWDAREALAPLGTRAQCAANLDALLAAIVAETRSGDHVLVMSNGGFGGIHERILGALNGSGG